jgi:hypothetical protein
VEFKYALTASSVVVGSPNAIPAVVIAAELVGSVIFVVKLGGVPWQPLQVVS